MKLTAEQQDIVAENHNLIYWYINRRGLKTTDWYDLLAIELCYAVIKYNKDRGSFSNYFKMRADNLIRKEYSKTQLKKNKRITPSQLDNETCLCGTQSDMNIIMEVNDLFNGENGDIIKMRAEGYTQSEIADIVGVTQSYISKIIDKKRKAFYETDR